MFGRKAARIEELETRNKELRGELVKLSEKIWKLGSENSELKSENGELKKELSMIKPVFETSGFKPAVSDKCENCKYAYFSDYDNNMMLGCCRDVVCKDYEYYGKRKDD